MKEFDSDGDGNLDFQEFRQLYRQKLLPIIEAYVLKQAAEEAGEASESSEMVWQCDHCETAWDTLEEAGACEERCLAKDATHQV